MDDIKLLTNPNSFLQLSGVLHKQLKAIRAHKTAASAKAEAQTKTKAKNTAGTKTTTQASTATPLRDHQLLAGCREHEQLQLQCQSDNVQLSQLSFHAYQQLVKEGTLDAATVMTVFVSMVPAARRAQLVALSEAVIALLLQDLKQRSGGGGADKSVLPYVCPFGLQQPQHPLLAFVQHAECSFPDLVAKMVALCRKQDRDLRRNICEFLRPVFLYVFCGPVRWADSGPLWTQLLELSRKDERAQRLVLEVLGWSNLTTEATLLQTTHMLAETIQLYQSDSARSALTLELCLYLLHLLPALIARGYTPLPALKTITACVQLPATSANATLAPYANVLLVALTAHLLPVCAPSHLPDVCALLRFVCVAQRAGNAVTLRMLQSAVLNWVAVPQLLRTDCEQLLHVLLRHVCADKWRRWAPLPATPAAVGRVGYFHPALALSVDVARHSEWLCAGGRECGAEAAAAALGGFHRLAVERPLFCHRINLYMRALFLLEAEQEADGTEADIAQALLQSTRASRAEAAETFWTWLYRTLNETDGRRLVQLLRGLAVFGSVRENIPRILATLRAMSAAERVRPMVLQLYFELWRAEERTFVYLREELRKAEDEVVAKERAGRPGAPAKTAAAVQTAWEMNVARAMTIRDICKLEPSKYGTDLILHVSHILNHCADAAGETATCIALATITGLCGSHTINIASTWTALREMFAAERRPRALAAQCEFFGQVPRLVSPTDEYERCVDAALRFLWRQVQAAEHSAVRVAALRALQNFDYTALTFEQVPVEWQPERPPLPPPPATTAPTTSAAAAEAATDAAVVEPPPPPITGEFWPQLVQLLGGHDDAVSAACSDLINHYIHCELRTFRQHLYKLADGHVEPLNYNRLPASAQSPLRACVKALLHEANRLDYERDRHHIRYVLRALTERLQRPLPPLNWFWIVELMAAASDSYQASEETLETRSACLRLVVHQQMHSESARQIVEDYFGAFRADEAGDDELRLCIGLFGVAAQGMAAHTLDRWLQCTALYAWAFGKQNGFDEDSYFGLLLDACARFFAQGEPGEAGGPAPVDSENYQNVALTLAEYYAHFVHDFGADESVLVVRMFGKYQRVFEAMQPETVERIVVPMGWQEAALCGRTWRRALECCGALVTGSEVRRSLRWLNAAVENNRPETQGLLFEALDAALGAATDERDACLWAMDLLSVIQAFLTGSTLPSATIAHNVQLRMRMFCTVVVVRAGFERLRAPAPLADGSAAADPLQSCWRLALFPQALVHLVERAAEWTEQEQRIYEFFYNVATSAGAALPAAYMELIRRTFVCARQRPYFGAPAVWRRMVGLRVEEKQQQQQ